GHGAPFSALPSATPWLPIAAKLGVKRRQAREHYHVLQQHTTKDVRRGQWTSDEISRLREAVERVGHIWSRVSEVVETRTANQCKMKHHYLTTHRPASETVGVRAPLPAVPIRGRPSLGVPSPSTRGAYPQYTGDPAMHCELLPTHAVPDLPVLSLSIAGEVPPSTSSDSSTTSRSTSSLGGASTTSRPSALPDARRPVSKEREREREREGDGEGEKEDEEGERELLESLMEGAHLARELDLSDMPTIHGTPTLDIVAHALRTFIHFRDMLHRGLMPTLQYVFPCPSVYKDAWSNSCVAVLPIPGRVDVAVM
ncbi:hypothetical protein KIPB_010172, partial [Kipferlia bialata]